ncbi:Uncharacterized protein TCM_042791 [Theobroma cacao]|uniref:Uncharacterized protein n=1 Tax=Theobroma cacao TaxID=3641 RepID=A0A061FNG7_THECC|nr:Uncharacterized protein TCM_042791 [Theobroma cacao]
MVQIFFLIFPCNFSPPSFCSLTSLFHLFLCLDMLIILHFSRALTMAVFGKPVFWQFLD